MTIRAVVLDFGNVVGFFDHRRATHRLARHSALASDVLHQRIFGGMLELAYEKGEISTATFVQQSLLAGELTCSPEEFATSFADIFWPNEVVCAQLPALASRYPLALLSNTNELHAGRFQAQFAEVFRHFGQLVFSHQVGARKPEAAIFEHTLARLGLSAEEVVLVDDLPANVAGARQCGWRGVVYETQRNFREALAASGVVLD